MKETFYKISGSCGRSLTIALIADLHDHDCSEVLASLHKRKPDLIACAGDLIYGVQPKGHMLKTVESVNTMRFLRESSRVLAAVQYSKTSAKAHNTAPLHPLPAKGKLTALISSTAVTVTSSLTANPYPACLSTPLIS